MAASAFWIPDETTEVGAANTVAQRERNNATVIKKVFNVLPPLVDIGEICDIVKGMVASIFIGSILLGLTLMGFGPFVGVLIILGALVWLIGGWIKNRC